MPAETCVFCSRQDVGLGRMTGKCPGCKGGQGDTGALESLNASREQLAAAVQACEESRDNLVDSIADQV